MKSVYLNQNLICIESEIKVCDFFSEFRFASQSEESTTISLPRMIHIYVRRSAIDSSRNNPPKEDCLTQ